MLPLLLTIAQVQEPTIFDKLNSPLGWGVLVVAIVTLVAQGFFRELGKKLYERFTKPKDETSTEEEYASLPSLQKTLTNITIVSRGDDFVGRDDALRQLHQRLKKQGQSSAIVGKDKLDVVHGAGGIGKTQLAVEYAARYHEHYNALLMVIAESPQKLDEELAELVETLVPEAPPEHKQNQQTARGLVLQWLQTHPGWLLILDNIDTPEALAAVQQLLPRLTGGRVLATSRLDHLGDAFDLMPIDLLSQEDSIDFLLKRTDKRRTKADKDAAESDKDETLAEQLAERLDGLPLSLEQAAAQINEQHLSLARYLQLWDTAEGDELMQFVPANGTFSKPAAVTWKVSIEAAGPDAAALLRVLAWFAPEPIPMFLIDRLEKYNQWLKELAQPDEWEGDANEGDTEHVKEPKKPLLENIGDVRGALGRLCAFSLAKFTEDKHAFTVHRVLMAVTRSQMPPEHRDRTLSQALRWLNLTMPQDSDDVRTWPEVTPLVAHATQACEHNASDIEPLATGRLLNQVGMYHKVRAAYALAEPLYRKAIQITESKFSQNHPNVSAGYNNLAELLREAKQYDEAERLIWRAIEIGKATLGEDHPTIATRYNNLANLLRDTERNEDAEKLYRRAIEIGKATLGEDHSDVAVWYNNLAELLREIRQYEEAERLFRRAMKIDENTLGKNHIDVAIDYGNLALLLIETKRAREALPLLQQALTIFVDKLPIGHPYIKSTRKRLELCQKALEQGE